MPGVPSTERKCPFCDVKFTKKAQLKRHKQVIHSINLSPNITVELIVPWSFMSKARHEALQ